MGERVGYWRWLGGGLVAFPGRLKATWKWVRKLLMIHRRVYTAPSTEIYLGTLGLTLSFAAGLWCVISNAPIQDRLACSAAAVFMFLLMTHGIYRTDDC